MGSVVKREVVTSQNPDGTYVTTTRTRTLDRHTEYEYDYDDDVSNDLVLDSCGYCCTPTGALRILQILVGFVIVGCVSSVYGPGPFFDVLGGQTYVLVVACVCVCVTFVLLVTFALGFHHTILGGMPWREIDLFYSIVAVILYLVAGGVEVWYAIGLWDTKNCQNATIHNVMQKNCPLYIAWIIAAACCFLNVLLYALGALLSRMGKYYT